MLKSIGAPSTKFPGADLIMAAYVQNMNITGKVWQVKDQRLVSVSPGNFKFDLLINQAIIDYGAIEGGPLNVTFDVVPVSSIVSATINNNITNMTTNKPFRIQAITVGAGLTVADRFDKSPEEMGKFSN